MAGNKPALKIKPKDDRSRMIKSGSDNCLPKSNKSSDPDLTVLRKPIETSVTGFYEAFRVFESGSDEIRNLLGKECDILYECKVCRCIFRSLANFLSHKRVYCSQSFNSKVHAHFADTKFKENDTDFIFQKEKEYRSFWNKRKNDPNLESRNDDEPVVPPITKDLTTIVERLTEDEEITQPDNNDDDVQFCFEEIPTTSVAVFKNRMNINGSHPQDTMKAQVTELTKLEARKSAVLNADGEFIIQDLSNGPVIQISDDEDDNKIKLECKKCNITFSTQKTLKFHMKKHYENRIVYSCTDCSDLFSTSWSVYRHLYKVHKKTAAQIKRLRDSIQSKIFRIDRPPVQYKKKKAMEEAANDLLTDAEKRERENKAWVDNMEYDGVVPRCGGCGRSFERRAALAAHAHICQRRASKLRRQPSPTQIQTVGDDPLEQSSDDKSTSKEKIEEENEKKKKTSQEDYKLQDDSNSDDDKSTAKAVAIADSNLQQLSVQSDFKCELTEAQINDILNSLTHMLETEKENVEALDLKIAKNVGKNLVCELCNTRFSTLSALRKHLASHYDWNRYICKICEFRCYDKNDCINHVFDTHKIRGNKNVSKAMRALTSAEAIVNSQSEIKNDLRDEKENHQSFTSSDSKSDSKSPSISRSTTDDENSSNKADVTQSRKRNRWKRSLLKPQKKQRIASVEEDNKSANEPRNTDNDSPDEYNDQNKDIEDESPKTDIETVMQVIFGDESRSAISKSTVLPTYSRPARHRMRHLRDDFEYDLSNIIKMKNDPLKEAVVPPTKMATKRKQLLQNRSIAMIPNAVEEPPSTSTNASETNSTDCKINTEMNGPDPIHSVFIKSSRLPPLLTPAPILKARAFPFGESGNPVQMPTLLRMPPMKTSKMSHEEVLDTAQISLPVDNSDKEANDKYHSTEINILNTRKVSSETKIHSITFKKLEMSSQADEDMQADDHKITKPNQLLPKGEGPPRKILIIKGRPIQTSLLKQGMNTEKPSLLKAIGEPLSSVPDTLKGQIGSTKSIRLFNLMNLKPPASNIVSDEKVTNENMPENSSQNDAYPSIVLTTNEDMGDINDDTTDDEDDDGDNEDGSSLLNSDITNIAKLIDGSPLPK